METEATKPHKYTAVWLMALAAVVLLPLLGGVHLFDWDEVNFAEISREMLITGDYSRIYIDFQPFFQKPPLFFWLQAAAMQLFGVGEYAARLPNAICGIITIGLLYDLGRRLVSPRFGWIWAVTYLGSILPMLYFKSGIIDPVFNLFIFLGMYAFVRGYWRHSGFETPVTSRSSAYYFALGGLFIGLAMLTKGQAAYMIVALTLAVYWVYSRFRIYISIPQFLLFTGISLLVALVWLAWELGRDNGLFIKEFLVYQWRLFSTPDAGHKGFPGYHVVVLLVGCFPASLFAIPGLFKRVSDPKEAPYRADFRRWMKFLFWTVLVLFSVVQSKIVHYSSLAYFPLTYLAAEVIARYWSEGRPAAWSLRLGLALVGGLYVLVVLSLPWLGRFISSWQDLVQDPFARGNLEAQVSWSGWEGWPGLWLLLVLVVSWYLLARARWKQALPVLFGGVTLFVLFTLVVFINRIESYSQRAAIEFFTNLQNQPVYVMTHGYKSYAHLFYSNKQPHPNPNGYDREWLLRGAIDRDVYVSTKVHKAAELDSIPGFERLYARNGFVFYRREAVVKNK